METRSVCEETLSVLYPPAPISQPSRVEESLLTFQLEGVERRRTAHGTADLLLTK